MPQPQRWSPSWPTSSHGVSWKCRLPESSPSTTCGKRTDSSNCATPAASWCCDREWRRHRWNVRNGSIESVLWGSRPVERESQPLQTRGGRFAEYRRELATRLIIGDTVVVARLLYLVWHHKL